VKVSTTLLIAYFYAPNHYLLEYQIYVKYAAANGLSRAAFLVHDDGAACYREYGLIPISMFSKIGDEQGRMDSYRFKQRVRRPRYMQGSYCHGGFYGIS
jgi:hypothetical protein